MSAVLLEYAICKWEDRGSAEYFPINNITEHETHDGKKISTVFDAYGRQIGEPNFNYPRPPTEEDINSNGTKYYRFNPSDDQKIIVYRKIES